MDFDLKYVSLDENEVEKLQRIFKTVSRVKEECGIVFHSYLGVEKTKESGYHTWLYNVVDKERSL